MSNKKFDKLSELDQIIRRALPVGMEDGVKLTIEFFAGFEKFNTRPYHNYETWSAGYRISGPVGEAGTEPTVVVIEEDLDDALQLWIKKRDEKRVALAAVEETENKFE